MTELSPAGSHGVRPHRPSNAGRTARTKAAIGIETRQVLPPGRTGGRGLTSYLLMPRPKDLVKGWLFVVTYVMGALGAAAWGWQSVLRALVVLAAIELLIYPARYQWNDIRGFVADQKHPSAQGRGRLPGPLSKARRHVAASSAVAVGKLAVAALLIVLLPGMHLAGVLWFAVVGVFGVAIVYEVLRSATTGRSTELPPPVRPGIVALWFVVGAGYAVRGLLGLQSAVDLSRHLMLTVTAAVALWCYGTAFVTSRWAIEATAFATVRGGAIVWTARADQAREHLLALARWLPSRISPSINDIRDWAPLSERTPMSAPWNLTIVVAGAAAALSGRLLCGSCPASQYAAVVALGAVATAVVAYCAGRRAIVLTTTALAVLGALTVLHVPNLAAAPWLVLISAYLFFTTRTMRKLDRPNTFTRSLGWVSAATGRLVFGADTWQALQTR